ncbi:histidine phosphatase family protein [Halegenticoccus tardaugens]|uniref:histidine phosphatase family protein n=1 Tax=Halegenticoccus tardaugens TaxID=2071624 RepID=UPI00100BA25E|nr:histidine phosphatase family protein [Halegenticoccus tardaugens]
MQTTVSLVRHAHASYVPDLEATRELSERGHRDAVRVAERLRGAVDAVVSSPSVRAVQTVEPLADALETPIVVDSDFKERRLAGRHVDEFADATGRLWNDFDASLPGGESNREAQRRGTAALDRLLDRYADRHVAVGTHGTLLTLVLNAYDDEYGETFRRSLSVPDVYRLTFEGSELVGVERAWEAR